MVIEPNDKNKDSIILEFKMHDAEDEKTLEDTVVSALAQIEEKNYVADLIARGIPAKHILNVGNITSVSIKDWVTIPLAQGIKESAKWYISNEAEVNKKPYKKYIDNNLLFYSNMVQL